MYKLWHEYTFSVLLDIYLAVELMGHKIILRFLKACWLLQGATEDPGTTDPQCRVDGFVMIASLALSEIELGTKA
jgi:hypothetical protein